MSKVIMVTGGSRSGKSVIAEQKAKEYGKRSTGYADGAHHRLLPQLRPGLCKVLLYHLNGLFSSYLYLLLLCLLWKYRHVRRFHSK